MWQGLLPWLPEQGALRGLVVHATPGIKGGKVSGWWCSICQVLLDATAEHALAMCKCSSACLMCHTEPASTSERMLS